MQNQAGAEHGTDLSAYQTDAVGGSTSDHAQETASAGELEMRHQGPRKRDPLRSGITHRWTQHKLVWRTVIRRTGRHPMLILSADLVWRQEDQLQMEVMFPPVLLRHLNLCKQEEQHLCDL
jgi:hypothetical protein